MSLQSIAPVGEVDSAPEQQRHVTMNVPPEQSGEPSKEGVAIREHSISIKGLENTLRMRNNPSMAKILSKLDSKSCSFIYQYVVKFKSLSAVSVDNDGQIDGNELITLVEKLSNEKAHSRFLKWLAISQAITMLITVILVVGLTAWVVTLSKDTSVSGGSLVSKGTSDVVTVSAGLFSTSGCPADLNDAGLQSLDKLLVQVTSGSWMLRVDGYTLTSDRSNLTVYTPLGTVIFLDGCGTPVEGTAIEALLGSSAGNWAGRKLLDSSGFISLSTSSKGTKFVSRPPPTTRPPPSYTVFVPGGNVASDTGK